MTASCFPLKRSVVAAIFNQLCVLFYDRNLLNIL